MRLSVLFLALGVSPGFAQFAIEDFSAEKLKRVDAALEAERIRQGVVGMTAGLSSGGTIRWTGAFGKADLENDVDVVPATVFRTGSLAKPMTAVAALRLWERGKLDLDAPVQRYVRTFPEKQWGVSVRMLLGHLGGIRGYRAEEMDSTRHYQSVEEPLRIFSGDALLHAPRTKYFYSSYGYNLAGAALAGAAGVPFLQLLTENVLSPAKMESTRDDNARAIIRNRTRWYSRLEGGQIINAPPADTSNKVPGGGMLTTAEDVLRFATAWQQEKLLKRSTMRMQTDRQKLMGGSATGYGLGWNLMPVAGHNAISHTGGQQGCRTILAMFPELKVTVAVLTNSDFANVEKFVAAALQALEGGSGVSRVDGISGVVARPN